LKQLTTLLKLLKRIYTVVPDHKFLVDQLRIIRELLDLKLLEYAVLDKRVTDLEHVINTMARKQILEYNKNHLS
jgi:hypothetical protein